MITQEFIQQAVDNAVAGKSNLTPEILAVQGFSTPTIRRLFIMEVRPLHDRVLVKRFEEEEKSKGGIIIPDTAKEKPIQGQIIAVGTGRVTEDGKIRPLEVKKGDKVLFGKYAGTEIKIEGDDFLMMREEDILGIIQ